MGLKAPSKLGVSPSRFSRLPNKFTRSSNITQTVPTSSDPRANIKVVIGVTADHSATFTRSANIGVALTVSATGLNTGGIVFGTAVVSVGITSTASANVTRSGVASIAVGITSTCTGALATQTYYGTGVINVGITATASGTSYTTHTGTADCQVNIDIVATGLTDTQIPDETANANVMTLYGGATLTDDAVIGTRAVAFDGVEDYGRIDNTFQSTFQSSFSLSAWVRVDDGDLAGASNTIFSTVLSGYSNHLNTSYVQFYFTGGKLRGNYRIAGGNTFGERLIQATDSSAESDGQTAWIHVVMTADSSSDTVKIYKDGSEVGSATNTAVDFTSYSSSVKLAIGLDSEPSGTDGFLAGKIDDVSIWSTELSSTDVSNLYNSGSGTDLTDSSDLAGWWKMGEGSTATIVHTGTADCQVNIDIVATGLTNNQIPDETVTVSSMTLHGDALLTGDAAIGTKAIAFDGSSGYGVINDTFQSTFQSPFSISMWLKPDDGQDGFQRALFRTYATSSDYIIYEMQLGKLYFYIHDDSAGTTRRYETTSAVFSDGAQSSYTHTIVTVDSTATPIIYINGSSVGLTQTHSDAISLSNYAGIGKAVIGTFSEASPAVGSKFKGKIDDVSLWSTQLSSTQATNLYNSGSGTDLTGSSDLEGWWKMGEGSTALPPNGTATITASITASATGTLIEPAAFSNSYSLAFDGTNDLLRTTFNLADMDGAGTATSIWQKGITVSGWIMWDAACADNIRVFQHEPGGHNRLGLDYVRSTGKFGWSVGSKAHTTADLSLSAGEWHHFCVTCEPSSGHIWSGHPGPYSFSGTTPFWYVDAELYINGSRVSSIGHDNGTSWVEAAVYGSASHWTLDGAVDSTETDWTIDAAPNSIYQAASGDPRIGYIGNEQILISADVDNGHTSMTVQRGYNSTTATSHADGAVILNSHNELVFGAMYYYWPYYYYWNGKMDELAVWDEALTYAEATALYNSGTPIELTSDSGNYASSANLQGWWRMEENTGTTVADSSSNSNTGTLVNGPTFDSSTP
jgi:hypothetical protein